MLEKVSHLRGLNVRHAVKSSLQSRAEIEKQLLEDFNDKTDAEELDADASALELLGLLPPKFDLRSFLVRLLVEQIAGYYRPKTKMLYLADWLPVEEQRTVMVHELTHALQDQHFDLARFDRPPAGHSDRDLAFHALVEGEATAVMLNYTLESQHLNISKLPVPLESMFDQVGSGDPRSAVLNSAPTVIRETLLFPYLYGVLFVQRLLIDSGGSWNRVTAAYHRLPESTEQIMHPDRFLQGDTPVEIKTPALERKLGSNWIRRLRDVNGEFGYYLILTQYLSKETAARAAEGWGGDQMVMLEDPKTKNRCLVHLSVWDTTNDAIEFFDAYSDRTSRRLGIEPQPVESPGGSGRHVWKSSDTTTLLERRGEKVLAIESLPRSLDGALPGLVSELWKSRIRKNQKRESERNANVGHHASVPPRNESGEAPVLPLRG